MHALGSRPDPMIMTEQPGAGPSHGFLPSETAARGKVNRSALTGIIKTIIVSGQSLMCTAAGSVVYTPTSSNIFNLNPYDGGLYQFADPIFGCQGLVPTQPSGIFGPLGDALIANHSNFKVVLIPVGLGGTRFDEWVPDLPSANVRVSFFWRVRTAILRARAMGLEPDHIIWGQGETDNVPYNTAQASITASIRAIVDGIRDLACAAPFWVNIESMNGGVLNANIINGEQGAVETARNIKQGFNLDAFATVAGGYRLFDNTHLSDAGAAFVGQGLANLIEP